jgi:uncharacterized protein (DUF2267 family)
MRATGLEVFDTTVQATNAWLKEIMETTGPDRRRAYHVLTAVLHALRDRLTVDEVAQLGAQLPILVRGLYYVGRSSLKCSITGRTPEIRTAIRRS